MEPIYADVILPVPIPQVFTYHVPEELCSNLFIGSRVLVPFGRKKIYSGVVSNLHHSPPSAYQTKDILSSLDQKPVVNENQLRFWSWMSEYYQCSVGEVYKAALPSGLKLESETKVIINEEFNGTLSLRKQESDILDYLARKKSCTIHDLQSALETAHIVPSINRLINEGVISVNEHIKESFKPKTISILTLSENLRNEESLRQVFASLERAPKQLETLMQFISLAGYKGAIHGDPISKSELLDKCQHSTGPLLELLKKHILLQTDKEVGRIDTSEMSTCEHHPLTPGQKAAFDLIVQHFTTKETVLLHGVTSSGKTEIYIHLIEEQIKKGKQVLYLLPEIALTTQITSRLKKHFGNRLGIYHSKYSDAERVEIWNLVLEGEKLNLILGARSALFLPLTNLGLVIVDEEHESSFKQYDPAPRYHARDAAIVLAGMQGAKVLLGSATPSLESYYNTMTGKFGLVELTERYQGIQMPKILTANVREARRKKQMHSHFTPLLVEEMKKALDQKEQIILFQNRRGFAPYVECAECSTIPRCKNCDVSMTYHKQVHVLTCHYCGYSYALPQTCPACGSPALETRGFGTEKIEEELKIFFPEAQIARMDLDTSRTRKAHERIISSFEQRQIDILIGTQMISKGLDFDHVSLVGILDADSMLNYPDFRAYERAFQLMTQVSGRAGRKNKQGTVVLQTSDPDHPVIRQVIDNGYQSLFTEQMTEREQYKYPPFYRLIHIAVRHNDQIKTRKAAINLTRGLSQMFGDRVLGPHAPLIARIQNLHIQQIVLKLERKASPAKAKEMIQRNVHSLLAQPEYRSVQIQIDVDPL